jgi:Fe-S cluster biosynthesis and repair protein YggX
MAHLDKFPVQGMPSKVRQANMVQVQRAAWDWFNRNQDMVVLEKRFLRLKIRVRVRHLHRAWVSIFGPERDLVA